MVINFSTFKAEKCPTMSRICLSTYRYPSLAMCRMCVVVRVCERASRVELVYICVYVCA